MARRTTAIAAAAAMALYGASGSAAAQQRQADVDVRAGQGQVQVEVDAQRNRAQAGKERGRAAAGTMHRASEIQGMTVKNAADEDLGTVSDIVIDVRAGKVRYAALSYGGVLGLGDKLFAVPWTALEHRRSTDENDDVLVLNVDEAVLKKAPGFDQSNWPNFADPKFGAEIDEFYRDFQTRRGANVDLQIGRTDVEIDVDAQRGRDANQKPASSRDIVHRSSKLTGMTVKNAAGEDLGSVNDLVIDMDSGNVRYAALSFGGVLGIGDKLFAVPWRAFDCHYDPQEEDYYLTLAVDEATLKNAAGFDQDNWPNFADPRFTNELDKQFPDSQRRTPRAERRREGATQNRPQPQQRGEQ